MKNHQIRLAARPVGLPKPTDWQFTEEEVPEPKDGEVLVKVQYISLDPAMRGWMNDAQVVHPRRWRSVKSCARAPAGRWSPRSNPKFKEGDMSPAASACRSTGSPTARALIEGRHAADSAHHVHGHARHAGHDRVLRAARCRQAASRARRWWSRVPPAPSARRRADREDQGLPRGRHRGRARRSAAHRRASSASTRRSTTSTRT